jgi:hypothetical protein
MSETAEANMEAAARMAATVPTIITTGLSTPYGFAICG